jgi:hypothetical protein
MDDIAKLLEAASTKTDDSIFNLGDSELDVFLKENLYSEDDLSKRVFLVDLFEMYAHWYHAKHNNLPSIKTYTRNSGIIKKHTVKGFKKETQQLINALKCSAIFKINYLKFKEENPAWSIKLKRIQSAKKAHLTKKGKKLELTPREKEHLEMLASSQVLIKDSSQE